ncbi:MAG: hypothetical protein WA130_03915 [Candidatus Methanoperedens sp.]
MNKTQSPDGVVSAVVMKNGTCIYCGRSFRGNEFENVCSDVCLNEVNREECNDEPDQADDVVSLESFSILGVDESAYRRFCLYFEEMNEAGAPYSTSDMVEKALDLGLPLPEQIKYIQGKEMTPGGIYRLPRIKLGGRWFWIDERLKEYRSADHAMLTVINENDMSDLFEIEEVLDSIEVAESEKLPLRNTFTTAVNGDFTELRAQQEAWKHAAENRW